MRVAATLKLPSEDSAYFVWVQVHEDANGVTDYMRVPGGWLYRNIIYARGAAGAQAFEFYVPASEVRQDSVFAA